MRLSFLLVMSEEKEGILATSLILQVIAIQGNEDPCCEVECIEELLLKLDMSKTNGPDGISGKMLK